MATAFVLINMKAGIEAGTEADVLKIMMQVEGVDKAYSVYGVYDIIAKVTAESMEQLKEIISQRIRRIEKVQSTLTMLVIEKTK